MRVLVTGGAGYIGSHVVWELLEAGHEPVVIDNLSKGHAAALPIGVSLLQGDLADASFIRSAISTVKPQAVMHFAGFIEVGESVQQPGRYYRNNVSNTLNLLEAMVEFGVQYIVFSSTAAVYGEPIRIPIEEDHPKVPLNPYGESKLFVESILARYEQAHGVRSICLRYFNAAGAHPSGRIGEAHHPETHLRPIVLQAAAGPRPHGNVYGTDYATEDGSCVRDYVHVCDLAAAHRLATQVLAAGGPSGIYNLGNGRGISVRQIIAATQKVTGQSITTMEAPRRAGDPAVLVASAQLARQKLGWQPQYTVIDDIIDSAWRWHKAHPLGFA